MRGAASTRVRFLKSDKVCLDQELAALKAMKRNVQKLHQQQKRRGEQRTREDDDMALVVLALTMPDVTCLKEYLDQKRCLTRGQEEEESRLNRTVDRLLAMPDDDIVTLLEPTDELGAARLRRATGFVSDFGMHQWVVSMNGARGVAPRVSSAIHRRCELLRQIGRTACDTTELVESCQLQMVCQVETPLGDWQRSRAAARHSGPCSREEKGLR
jgi:hypothetical protein